MPQTRTHSENMAEAAARAVGPANVSTLIGTGALVDQTASDLDRAADLLKGFLSEDRMSRMQDVLDQRTRSATLVFENPANPNNVRDGTLWQRWLIWVALCVSMCGVFVRSLLLAGQRCQTPTCFSYHNAQSPRLLIALA